jgi:cyclophilin family peptidyl-prolyl cis-trans isomerase
MIHTRLLGEHRRGNRKRHTTGGARLHRRARFEELESRQLLSITLPTITAQTLSAGAPLSVALNGSSDHTVSYSVAVSNSSLTNSAVLTATIPEGNPSLRITVDDVGDSIHGDMVFQLAEDLAPEAVDTIIDLVNNTSIRDMPFYDGLTFHRILENFMIQGGDPSGDGTGGPGFSSDEQYNSELQFTSFGILALANSNTSVTSDTDDSQFFITTSPYRYGDFRYTILGFLTEGGEVLDQIQNVPVHENSIGEESEPDNTVTMTTVMTFTDTQNGVLRLSVPDETTGSADVTVTATDSVTLETTSQTFHLTVVADTYNDPPYLDAISPIVTSVNAPVSFDVPATDVEGDAILYGSYVLPDDSNPDLTITVNSSTGHATLTPTGGISGVYSVMVGVRASTVLSGQNPSWDTQRVPVYINPAAPAGVTLLSTAYDGVTNLNNTSDKTLQFQVTGVLSGTNVKLYAGSTLIGEDIALGTSITITTNGTATLPDGVNSITATQTLEDQMVNVGNLNTTVDLTSASSSSLTITVDTTSPEITVLNGTTVISSGATTPIDLGSAYYLQAGTSVTLTIRNDGGQLLTLTTPFASTSHFTLGQPDVTTLAARQTTTFTVTLDTDAVWTGSEQISFVNNDADGGDGVESPFTFVVSGSVTKLHDSSTAGMYNPATSRFYLRNSNDVGTANVTFSYGPASAGWTPLVGDWDGDGTVTIGLYDPSISRFYLRNSNNIGMANVTFSYGPANSGWKPIVGDWNADGLDTVGLYDPAKSRFYLRNANTSGMANVTFAYGPGGAGWTPLVGDWDGDGLDTVGLYNPSISRFYLRNTNSNGTANVTFIYGPGSAGWKPITGDWNADGTDTIGLYNPSISRFYLRNSNSNGTANTTFIYGAGGVGWLPVVGDWDGVTYGLCAADGAVVDAPDATPLSASLLQPLVAEAIARWTAAGLPASSLSAIKSASIIVTDLPGAYLGTANGHTISIDVNAAGRGWFVDPTPSADEEFAASAGGGQLLAVDPRAVDRIDLLSVIEHELGHLAGFADLDALSDDLMSGTLGVGIRRDPVSGVLG